MGKIICRHINDDFDIDGDLSKDAWSATEKSPRFVDVIGGTPALYDTRAALLWSFEYLYIGFWCEEPYPRASTTKRDSPLWGENMVEVFIDGADTYYELQVNALNTIYEAFYIWQDAYSRDPRYAAAPEFDIFANKARVFGGNHDRDIEHFWNGSHPRGNRWAFINWDLPGLKTAVQIDGKLNDDSVVSKKLTVEIAMPWSGMAWLAGGKPLPPQPGDQWRVYLGRNEKLRIGNTSVCAGWAANQIGHNDPHTPERFSVIEIN